MFENPRRGRQAKNFTTNVPKILDHKSSSEQIFSENCRWVPPICAAHITSKCTACSYCMAKANVIHILLYRHECFTGKYTTCKIHKNYIQDPSGLFSIYRKVFSHHRKEFSLRKSSQR